MRPEASGIGRRLLGLALAFAFMVALIESVRSAGRWWQQGAAALDLADWLLIAALPLLAAAWVWKFSPFAPGRGQCLLPEERAPGAGAAETPERRHLP